MSGKRLQGAKFAENVQTTQYTVPLNTATIIDGVQVANNSGAAATITINVVTSGGAVAASNVLQPTTSVAAGTKVTMLAGTWMSAGDFISTLAGTASALVIHIGGREFP